MSSEVTLLDLRTGSNIRRRLNYEKLAYFWENLESLVPRP